MIENPFSLDYVACRDHLLARLREPAPGRIQVLTGPRQVGKTTLLLEIADRMRPSALYAAADAPEAALPGFWERTWLEAEARAAQGTAVLLIDEIHNLHDWAKRLKGHWDRLQRRRIPLHVLVTGSSALRVSAGSREALTGRFERLTLTHWSARAMSTGFGVAAAEAAELVVRIGSYPGAFSLRSDLARWRAYVRDAIVEPAIGRDVVALGAVRKPALLRQVFAAAVAFPAQVVSLQKLQGQLQDAGALETIAHYLTLLQDGYLVAALEKFSAAMHRRRSAPPKLVTLNNALLSAIHPDGPPEPDREPARFGTWVENACVAFAVNQGQEVTYWREEPLEVDAVVDGGWGSWALEVKTGTVGSTELRGLLEFTRRYPRYRPVVVTAPGREAGPRRLGIAAVDWREFLVHGPAAALAAP